MDTQSDIHYPPEVVLFPLGASSSDSFDDPISQHYQCLGDSTRSILLIRPTEVQESKLQGLYHVLLAALQGSGMIGIDQITPSGMRESEKLGDYQVIGSYQSIFSQAPWPMTEYRGDPMTALQIAAEIMDEAAFLRIADTINWTYRPAHDYARAVHLALAAGAHFLARILAERGARAFPENSELAKMGRVLAPPRVVRADLPPDESIGTNREWLKNNADRYRGKWVALKAGRLLTYGATVEEVSKQIENLNEVLVTKVL